MRIVTIPVALLAATLLGTVVSGAEIPRRTADPDITGSVSGTEWVGIAAARNGRVFKSSGLSEAGVRASIRSECEQTAGSTCRAIVVPVRWDVVVVQCNRGGRRDAFLGGSIEGNASWIAYEKARQNGYDDSQCREIYSY